MKVLQINAVYGSSSTGRTCKELDEGLQARGIESFVATPTTTENKNNIHIIGNLIDRKAHALQSRLTGLQGYYSHLPTLKLTNYISSIEPDVIHLRNLHGNYINVPMLLKHVALNKIPIVITLHDCWFYTGRCCHYTDDNCDRWMKRCGKCPSLKRWNPSWFFDRSAKMLRDKKKLFDLIERKAVIGVSDWITNEVKNSILSKSLIIKRIYNWIDLKIFYPKETKNLIKSQLNIQPTTKIILAVAHSWSSGKGFDSILNLARSMQHEDCSFVLVGGIKDTSILPDNIISVGTLNNPSELADYYSAADVFITPSLQETFGKTTVEALACGTPAVGYQSTATTELIKEGCGKLVPVEDSLANFKSAIKDILKVGKKTYANNCLLYVQENFDKEKLIEEYIDLYKGLCK